VHEQAMFFSENLEVMKGLLPEGWKEKAKDLGATERFKGFSNLTDLLLTLFINVGYSA
jgi:hypothetical protein